MDDATADAPASSEAYIASLAEPRRSQIAELDALIREVRPDLTPFLYGTMLGYGPYHYRYASGREGDTAKVALASQKSYISLYVLSTVGGAEHVRYLAEEYVERLPKANIGKSCIRFKRPADLDRDVLRELLGRVE